MRGFQRERIKSFPGRERERPDQSRLLIVKTLATKTCAVMDRGKVQVSE